MGTKSTKLDMGPVQFLVAVLWVTIDVIDQKSEIDAHEFTAQFESTANQRVIDPVYAKSKCDGGHVVKRAATSVRLWSQSNHQTSGLYD